MSKDDFKYYDKIKVGFKFRYFYSKQEYDAYMNNKKKDTSPFKAVSNFLEKFGKKTVNEMKSKVSNGKAVVDKILEKMKKTPKKVSVLKKLSAEAIENIYIAKSNERHKSKYIYKETLPNGKFRYFYSEKEHKTYLKKLQYQKDSPSFMSKIKRTADLTDRDAPILTEKQDTEQINEKYFEGKKYQQNCMLATTAYELRCRGYDVEAKPNDDGFRVNQLKKWYEDAKPVHLGGGNLISSLIPGTRFDKPSDLSRVTKGILKNNPPGSRGNIMVQWKGTTSGHSMIYEVDASNNVILRDAQVATVNRQENIQLPELLTMIDGMSYVRTDNLKLKPAILEAINDN
jgi:hypothetical protein